MNREDLLWSEYIKCDGMPDPVCVKQMNTYLRYCRIIPYQEMEEKKFSLKYVEFMHLKGLHSAYVRPQMVLVFDGPYQKRSFCLS